MLEGGGHQLIDPQILFSKVELRPQMHVADFGVGRTGHLVFPAAQVVGEAGVVYAVDILKDVLESVRKRAELEHFVNVHTVWADIERSGSVAIPAKTLDVVFLVNVMFHISDYQTTLKEALRLLKDKGRIVVVDWVRKLTNLGPSDDNMVDFSKLSVLARTCGCAVQDDFDMGPYHKALIFFRHS